MKDLLIFLLFFLGWPGACVADREEQMGIVKTMSRSFLTRIAMVALVAILSSGQTQRPGALIISDGRAYHDPAMVAVTCKNWDPKPIECRIENGKNLDDLVAGIIRAFRKDNNMERGWQNQAIECRARLTKLQKACAATVQ